MKRLLVPAAVPAVLASVFFGAAATSAAPSPRRELAPEPLNVVEPFDQRLVVKFRDDVRARGATDGTLVSVAERDLSSVIAAAGPSARFRPLIDLPEATLAALEVRAEARSGRAQPDLAGMLVVEVPGASKESLRALGETLQVDAVIEWTSLEVLAVPPSTDLPPASGDLTANQGYRLPNPGLDSDFVSTVFVGDPGLLVRLSDCEYGWNPTHEDLNEVDLHLEPGQTISAGVFTNGWDEHGTAVAGASVGLVNEYGVSGMAPGVEFHTYPEWTDEEGFRRVTCITNAIANSNAGDVVLLEMQTVGLGGGYGPAELDLGVWTAVKVGTDAGVVVVGAAGNGNQNLDSATYASYLARGDSGAILVGAGSANTNHDKLSFSTYGARVDVQAWGTAVTTTGYGTVQYNGSDEDQWYTNGFNGTSSASSLTAPSCAVIQAVQLQYFGTPLTSPEMRDLLIATGWAQGTGGHIGPAVNIRAALESLLSGTAAPAVEASAALAVRAEPNPFRDRTRIRFDATASRETAVEVFDVAGRRVRVLPTEAGPRDRETTWDGRDEGGLLLAPGVYFLRVRDSEDSRTGRVVLSR